MTNRDGEIYRLVKSGMKKKDVAAKFSITRDRVRQIFIEEDFKRSYPNLAKLCGGRELAAAALLWSRGFKISKKG